jgi:hypothetical protein
MLLRTGNSRVGSECSRGRETQIPPVAQNRNILISAARPVFGHTAAIAEAFHIAAYALSASPDGALASYSTRCSEARCSMRSMSIAAIA